MATIPIVFGEIGEASTGWVRIAFLDEDGDPASPDAVTYSIHDRDSGTVVRAETFLPASQSIEVKLTPEDNRILNSENEYEYREVTVRATFGGSDACNARAVYRVDNFAFLS